MKMSKARKLIESDALPILLQVVLIEGSFPVGAFIGKDEALEMLDFLPADGDPEVRVTVRDECILIGDLDPHRNA